MKRCVTIEEVQRFSRAKPLTIFLFFFPFFLFGEYFVRVWFRSAKKPVVCSRCDRDGAG